MFARFPRANIFSGLLRIVYMIKVRKPDSFVLIIRSANRVGNRNLLSGVIAGIGRILTIGRCYKSLGSNDEVVEQNCCCSGLCIRSRILRVETSIIKMVFWLSAAIAAVVVTSP